MLVPIHNPSMDQVVISKNGVPIRLTDERWAHISEEHFELVGLRAGILSAIAQPRYIYAGNNGEHLAVRQLKTRLWLVAVYREMPHDGFVITAFVTSKFRALKKRPQLWP